ncbi:MAG: Na/Pi cotransporter family protein [Firmicutes bacterium]|nr:Na/Pi cotransporter family protein [Bacillota bacterium]
MPASIFRLVAGVLLFFAGISLLRKGLKRKTRIMAERALRDLTSKPGIAVIIGVLVTCAMQSSSAVTVIIVGLVDSGVLDIYQAFFIIIGANLGTCMTAYIVAFRTKALGFLAFTVSIFLFVFARRKFSRDLAVIFLGLGCIFQGVEVTGSALTWLAEIPDMLYALIVFGQIPLFGILAGAVFTGIIQSSSVVMAILVGLVREGLVDLKSAVSLALGSNIGTCITTLIAGLGASSAGRFTALLHLAFNLIGVIVILPVFNGFMMLVEAISSSDPGYVLANANTIFNFMSILVVFPWGRQFVDLMKGRRRWI